MAIKITDECIHCGACEPECPNNAIYEAAQEWSYADGTALSGDITLTDGSIVNADYMNTPLSADFYFIVPGKCSECVGFHDDPQCMSVCPVECCVDDPENRETKEVLEHKKLFLHG